jgi:hypothetical protein
MAGDCYLRRLSANLRYSYESWVASLRHFLLHDPGASLAASALAQNLQVSYLYAPWKAQKLSREAQKHTAFACRYRPLYDDLASCTSG